MSGLLKSLSKALSQREDLPEQQEELLPTTPSQLHQSGAKRKRTSALPRIEFYSIVLLKGFVLVLAIYGFVNLVLSVEVSLRQTKHDNWCDWGKYFGSNFKGLQIRPLGRSLAASSLPRR